MRFVRLWAPALTLLLFLVAGAPALAQEGTEEFNNDDTRRLYPEYRETLSEYQRISEADEACTDSPDCSYDRGQRLGEQKIELYDELALVTEDLGYARLEAIREAPVTGSAEDRIDAGEEKYDALQSLEVWADDNTDLQSDLPEDVGDELAATEDRIESLREDAASPEPAQEADPEDQGAAPAPGATDTDAPGGPLAVIGNFVVGVIGFLFTMIVTTPIVLAAMFALAWRREGDPGAAWRRTKSPLPIALAVGIAFFLWLFADYFLLIVLLAALAFGVLWWREGSAGGAFGRVRSWFPGGGDGGGGSPQDQPPQPGPPPPGPTVGGGPQQPKKPALEEYGRNLTRVAAEGRLEGEAVGREDEMEALVEVLTRRTTNNAVLTGGAGVGKTELARELARRLASGAVPKSLRGKELVELDVTALEAGASLVGMFQERLKGVIEEMRAQPDRYVLFVDEMHVLMGAGSHSNNPSGAANILKPALAAGELRMVGATTADEYRQIEQDPAMARRFERVDVPPLTVEATVEVLRRVAAGEEEHHGISVEDAALGAAAKLTDRYVPDQQLPAKAVNVLSTTCARAANRGKALVTAEDVAAVIARQTGVPVGSMSGEERDRAANVEEEIKKRMVGQYEAVSAVAAAVRRKRSGFGRGRPASFMFVGPTGVGKTELAKSLAEVLFGDEGAMVRLDMGEFHDRYTAARLVGSPPGYVGSDEGGQLTEPVRRRPYSVVLLDEVEKAHPQVLDPLLSVLDDGRLTDSRGRVADFSEAVVILTSNLAAEVVTQAWAVGQDVSEERMAEQLVARGMRPELVQRIGKIAVFEPPDPSDVKMIARRMLAKTASSMDEEHGVRVSFADEAVDLLAERGYDPENGLRPLRRVVEREVEDLLTDLVVENKVSRGDAIELAVRTSKDEEGRVLSRDLRFRPARSRSRQQ